MSAMARRERPQPPTSMAQQADDFRAALREAFEPVTARVERFVAWLNHHLTRGTDRDRPED